jgi:hypothetical protein
MTRPAAADTWVSPELQSRLGKKYYHEAELLPLLLEPHPPDAPQLQGNCRAECRDFAAERSDFGRRAAEVFGFCAPSEAARLVLKLPAGARRAVRPSALGGRIKRATSTPGTGVPSEKREGQKRAGKANLIYMACAAPVV